MKKALFSFMAISMLSQGAFAGLCSQESLDRLQANYDQAVKLAAGDELRQSDLLQLEKGLLETKLCVQNSENLGLDVAAFEALAQNVTQRDAGAKVAVSMGASTPFYLYQVNAEKAALASTCAQDLALEQKLAAASEAPKSDVERLSKVCDQLNSK